jgi:hypothetical protein
MVGLIGSKSRLINLQTRESQQLEMKGPIEQTAAIQQKSLVILYSYFCKTSLHRAIPDPAFNLDDIDVGAMEEGCSRLLIQAFANRDERGWLAWSLNRKSL